MNDGKMRFGADADSMNAMIDAMGALTMVLLARMPEEARQAAAADFRKLAVSMEKQGEVMLTALLLQLEQSARRA